MTPALLLAFFLTEPGAPSLPVRLYRAAVLADACQAEGLPGAECVAVAWQETRLRRGLVSSAGARGIMQVRNAYDGGLAAEARQGAMALAYWKRHRGKAWARGYACGNVDSSRRCLEYEMAIKRMLKNLAWLTRIQ